MDADEWPTIRLREQALPIDEADQRWHDAGHPTDIGSGSAWNQDCRACPFEEPQEVDGVSDEGPCWRCGGTGRLVKREGGHVDCPVCSIPNPITVHEVEKGSK